MRRVSTVDLVRDFGTYGDAALREPVLIMKNGRKRLVLLNVDDYNLCQRALEDAKVRRRGAGPRR